MQPASQTMMQEGTGISFNMLVMQLGIGVIVVLLVFIIGARLFKRFSFAQHYTGKNNSLLHIKYNQSVGSQGRLMIIEFNQQWLLIGVSSGGFTCLATSHIPEDDMADAAFFQRVFKKSAEQREKNDS